MRSDSRREYERRVNRVLDHISTHLDEDLDLARLAEIACFSPFHFHRIFSSVMGETLSACVRRLRLERAASLLAYDRGLSVTQVSLACGFSSPAVLSREFRKRFSTTPTAWREASESELRKIRQAMRKGGKAADEDVSYAPSVDTDDERRLAMHVEVKELPEMRLAYMRRLGPYGPECGETWGRFMQWAGPRGLLRPDAVTLGVSHDNPEVTPPEKCRYDVGVVVDEAFRPDEHVNVQTVPGGSYAIYAFKGRSEEIGKAWNDMFAVWFPDSGYQPGQGPCFERCHDVTATDAEILEMEICVPVKPL